MKTETAMWSPNTKGITISHQPRQPTSNNSAVKRGEAITPMERREHHAAAAGRRV